MSKIADLGLTPDQAYVRGLNDAAYAMVHRPGSPSALVDGLIFDSDIDLGADGYPERSPMRFTLSGRDMPEIAKPIVFPDKIAPEEMTYVEVVYTCSICHVDMRGASATVSKMREDHRRRHEDELVRFMSKRYAKVGGMLHMGERFSYAAFQAVAAGIIYLLDGGLT